jgi:hypothetical protein
MKSIDELIEESIKEIENKEKPIKQVFDEFFNIFTNRHQERIDSLDQQRLKEISNYKQELIETQKMIKDVLKHFDNMSINLIKSKLEEFTLVNFRH